MSMDEQGSMFSLEDGGESLAKAPIVSESASDTDVTDPEPSKDANHSKDEGRDPTIDAKAEELAPSPVADLALGEAQSRERGESSDATDHEPARNSQPTEGDDEETLVQATLQAKARLAKGADPGDPEGAMPGTSSGEEPGVIEEPGSKPMEPLPPFLLTNRYNLLEILSSGLVKPEAGFPKYYMDLLRFAPGRIPLLSAPTGADLVDLVSQGDETAFPVAIELHRDMVDLSETPADVIGQPITWAPDGVIPKSAISHIRFRTEEELREVKARRFRNLEIPVDQLSVSPEYFAPGAIDAEATIEWLGTLSRPARQPDLHTLDRLGGAWAMIVAAIPPDEDYHELAASLIIGIKGIPKPKGNEPAWIAGGRLRTLKPDRRRTADLNDRLFEASVEALLALDPAESWRPVEILDRIRDTVLPEEAVTDGDSELATALDYMKAVLRNETDLRPFNPERGYPAAKALLMVLLRPEPDRVLGWLASDINPMPPEFVAAAALSGVLTGWSQLPVAIRAAYLDAAVTMRIAADANAGASEPAWTAPAQAGPPNTDVRIGRNGEAVFLTSTDGTALFERAYELSLDDLVQRLELRSDSAALLDLAVMGRWEAACVVTETSARPLRASKGQDGTRFSGMPNFTQRVLIEKLRTLVAEHGLPPDSRRLRSALLSEHFERQ